VLAGANRFTDIPNSELPWVGGGEVILYRIETLLSPQRRDLSCEALASQDLFEQPAVMSLQGYERSSLADYWLSNWTNSSQPQDFSALGAWRENTALHVSLDATVKRCDCSNSDLCQRGRCTRDEFVLRVANPGARNDECGSNNIAFAVSAQLHFADASRSTRDTRVLPTFYSDGLFSLLEGEERLVCIAPSGPESNMHGRQLEIRLSGWNVKDDVVTVPKMC
jgi:hypothetical protein